MATSLLKQPPHIIVNAGAGTGKTTTITEGVGKMLGHGSSLVPSSEQKAVWDVMCEETHPGNVHMTSFSTAAAEQLVAKCPKDKAITCSSTYGMGLRQAFRVGLASGNKGQIHQRKYEFILSELLGVSKWQGGERFKVLEDLVQKARLELKTMLTVQQARSLAEWYGLDVEFVDDDTTEVVNDALKIGLQESNKFDYTDMVWIPNVLGVVKKTYACLVVDEYQDMGVAQQELCMKIAWRLVVIGDFHQAIYGFSGASSDAYKRMDGWLGKTQRGVKTLPMLMTRRCCLAVIAEANKLLPEKDWLTPLPEAPEGQVIRTNTMSLSLEGTAYGGQNLWGGDSMVICPTNAPLVSLIYKLQDRGHKAYVKSKDIAGDMLYMIGEKFSTVTQLIAGLQGKIDRLDRKMGRAVQAKRDTLVALQEISKRCATLTAVRETVKRMFPEKEPLGHLRMSSVHQAKGLEAGTVIFWEWDRCRSAYSTQDWQKQQDRNLLYVGITRAKTRLVLAKSELS